MNEFGPQLKAASDGSEQVETLLIELSARFISLPPDQIDREIQDAQFKICESLDLDRSSLWQQPEEDPSAFVMTHVYQRPMMPQPPPKPDARNLVPWFLDQVKHGKTVVISKLDDIPPEAAHDLETLRRYGTQSLVVVPFSVGSGIRGALSFASAREQNKWPEKVVKRLRLVAEVFANAISRARADRAQRLSEGRLRAVIETAADGIITIDERGLIDSINPAAVRIFGYEPQEVIGCNVSMLMPEPYHAEHDAYLASYLRTGVKKIIGFGREVVGRRKDGSTFPLDLAVSETRLDSTRRIFTGLLRDITQRKQVEEQLRQTLDEVQRLRDQLQEQNVYLQQEVRLLRGQSRVVGQSQALERVLAQVEQVGSTGSTVLLLGETGTGKGLIATAIHEQSPRRDRPMVRVNCSAIPASLIESELFGREKGAFTGALSKQIGRFEMANGSTLFLDEIGDLPSDMQVKLLRVLEERQIERLGSSKTISVDVRIIAATNRDLEAAVRDGRFREDLYYRLHVFPIVVPPLRERPDDIPALISAFVGEFSTAFGKNIESIAKESMDSLQRYAWPGNVRELRNVVERAMIVAKGLRLRIDLPGKATAATPRLTLNQVDREHICRVLELAGWRIRGKGGAAELLGLKPTTLESRMAKLGIHRRPASRTK
jgi:PAS domain S-box-containing protein